MLKNNSLNWFQRHILYKRVIKPLGLSWTSLKSGQKAARTVVHQYLYYESYEFNVFTLLIFKEIKHYWKKVYFICFIYQWMISSSSSQEEFTQLPHLGKHWTRQWHNSLSLFRTDRFMFTFHALRTNVVTDSLCLTTNVIDSFLNVFMTIIETL